MVWIFFDKICILLTKVMFANIYNKKLSSEYSLVCKGLKNRVLIPYFEFFIYT